MLIYSSWIIIVQLGGPTWDVPLGRRDSTTASLDAANTDLPSPLADLSGLISTFSNKGFTANEMVALSGTKIDTHTDRHQCICQCYCKL